MRLFVLETKVHFPTGIHLLRDALRKVITLTAQGCDDLGLTDWRPQNYHLRQVKRLMRTVQNKKRSKAVSAARAEKNKASSSRRISRICRWPKRIGTRLARPWPGSNTKDSPT